MDFSNPSCATNSLGTANTLLQSFVTTIFALHCNISSPNKWPEDYGESAIIYGVDEFDYIVVGAGVAGSIVAARLAENIDNKVLLVEAGGDPPMESEIPAFVWPLLRTEIDWTYKTELNRRSCLAIKNEICIWSAGKVIGGSHSMNAHVYVRGFPHDYDGWLHAGNPSWGWNDILYYFKKTEKFRGKNSYGLHGKYGSVNVEEYRSPQMDKHMFMYAAKELGYTLVEDFVTGQSVGFGQIYGTLRKGRSMSTAKAFLTRRGPNLFVMKHALARKIRFDSKLRAKGVSIVYKGYYVFEAEARKEVILSAGSIGTPKLLMLSGVGPKDHLTALGIPVKSDLDVGMNLQDHLRSVLFLRLTYEKPFDNQKEMLDAFFNQWVHRKGPYGAPVVDYVGYIATDGNPNVPDIYMIGVPVDNITSFLEPFKEHIKESIIYQLGPNDRLIVLNIFLLYPKSRGFIKLRSTDYRDDPLIETGYFKDRDDMQTLRRGIETIIDFEQTTAVRKLKGQFLQPYLPECDAFVYRSWKYWECYVRYITDSTYQYVGTAKMGPKRDRTSVVSSELKVHGVKGLRVADASIMPKIVGAALNAATMMIAERAADFINYNGSNIQV